MCELCSNNEEEKIYARQRKVFLAQRLETLASRYRALSCGDIIPHTDRWKDNDILAKTIIRRLIEDWI